MADSTGAQGAGTYELGPGSGRVLIRTGREGLAARAGHDLTLEITDWLARVTLPGEGGDPAGVTVTADLGLGSLAVREGTGGAKPLSDRDRRDIQNQARKILGDAARAGFTSQRVIPSSTSSAGSPTAGAVEGTLTLRGVSRGIRLEVTSPVPGRYRGSAAIRQTDFGITPYSGFFGALKLRDEVTVEFDVTIKDFQNAGA
ncbi:MAG TPA: YceI family protein [Trebonia sp.]